jgi:diadenosine tetraphosphatase ApaH/serine/threonine PP2A family protein phosphatase
MRVLIISDIHANLTAFEAVLADSQAEWDVIWCLGDLIGYGPNPDACVSLLREYDHISLSGNHDWAVLGKLDIKSFNREAQMAIEWTRKNITAESKAYLHELPAKLVQGEFTLAHASPRQPIWEYILDPYTASINFEFFKTPYCLVGHTHVPVWFEEEDVHSITAHLPDYDRPIQLNHTRLIINPGSVGQPRDSDPRAAYALLDTETKIWTYRRAYYPVHRTQEQMRQHNMPLRLIRRLEHGW